MHRDRRCTRRTVIPERYVQLEAGERLVIPGALLSLEQLWMPEIVAEFRDPPKGLALEAAGNVLLNEVLSKAMDKAELARRLGQRAG
jgi:hypothetical protein